MCWKNAFNSQLLYFTHPTINKTFQIQIFHQNLFSQNILQLLPLMIEPQKTNHTPEFSRTIHKITTHKNPYVYIPIFPTPQT